MRGIRDIVKCVCKLFSKINIKNLDVEKHHINYNVSAHFIKQ